MVDTTFTREVALPVSVEEAFAWHERPGALDRLIPPWESVHIDRRSTGVHDGERVVLSNRVGPFRLRWIAEHFDYQPNRQFRDRQVRGPFQRWEHLHRFQPAASGGSVMTDQIAYQIPGGPLGRFLATGFVRQKLERMFAYRHQTTTADLGAHSRYKEQATMQIAVTGSHGLVGSALIPFLTTGGHRVTRVVRGMAGEGEIAWNPSRNRIEAAELDGIDAVIHLAGENIAGRRWRPAQKNRIRDSRVNGTRALSERLAQLPAPPKVLISASAIGYYGDRGVDLLDESHRAGKGFLAEVAEAWEAATQPAVDAGIRVVALRFGIILSPKGGALAKMLPPFKLGAGGIIGDGRQYWSWVSIDDAVGAILHAIMTDTLSGPVNVVAPNAVTNREFTKTLGRVLSRPTVIPMPASVAKLALGHMADELLLASARIAPQRLLESEYRFRHPELEPALRHVLGRP